MAKRDLFTELMQGFEDLQSEREGKLTLRTTMVEIKPAPQILPQDIVALRETLRYSQGVFAAMLRTKETTLRKWEQGVSVPNTQARVLLGLVRENPSILQKIAAL